MSDTIRITATCDERETLRRIRLFSNKRYLGPFVTVEQPDGYRYSEYGLSSVNELLSHYEHNTCNDPQ